MYILINTYKDGYDKDGYAIYDGYNLDGYKVGFTDQEETFFINVNQAIENKKMEKELNGVIIRLNNITDKEYVEKLDITNRINFVSQQKEKLHELNSIIFPIEQLDGYL